MRSWTGPRWTPAAVSDGYTYSADGVAGVLGAGRRLARAAMADYAALLAAGEAPRRVAAGAIDECGCSARRTAASTNRAWRGRRVLVQRAAAVGTCLLAAVRGDGLQLRAWRGRDAGRLRPPCSSRWSPTPTRAAPPGHAWDRFAPMIDCAGPGGLRQRPFRAEQRADYDWGNRTRPSGAPATTGRVPGPRASAARWTAASGAAATSAPTTAGGWRTSPAPRAATTATWPTGGPTPSTSTPLGDLRLDRTMTHP